MKVYNNLIIHNNIYYPKAIQSGNLPRFSPVMQDTVCFKRRDFLDLPCAEIYEQIKNSVNDKNLIGEGSEARVYRIKNTKYCVKIPYTKHELIPEGFTKEITKEDKINHIKAKIGKNISIMDYIEGVTTKEYADQPRNRQKLMSKLSEMPVESYSDLLYQISNASRKKMLFDGNCGNIIINTKTKKLTAIDFFKVMFCNQPIPNPLDGIFRTVTFMCSDKKTRQKIGYKILMAGMEELKPETKPRINIEIMNFNELLYNILEFSKETTRNDMITLTETIKNLIYSKATNRFSKEVKEHYSIAIKYINKLFKP